MKWLRSQLSGSQSIPDVEAGISPEKRAKAQGAEDAGSVPVT